MVPDIRILTPENKTYAASSIFLSFTVNEATSWVGYSLDGGINVTIGGNTTLSSVPDGFHHVLVYANDTVGNMGASNTVYFTVDTTPPEIKEISQFPLKDNVQPADEVRVNATIIDMTSGVKWGHFELYYQ
jgi:hypothetical protein